VLSNLRGERLGCEAASAYLWIEPLVVSFVLTPAALLSVNTVRRDRLRRLITGSARELPRRRGGPPGPSPVCWACWEDPAPAQFHRLNFVGRPRSDNHPPSPIHQMPGCDEQIAIRWLRLLADICPSMSTESPGNRLHRLPWSGQRSTMLVAPARLHPGGATGPDARPKQAQTGRRC